MVHKDIHNSNKTIFTSRDLAVVWDIQNRGVLKNKISYWVKNNKLKRLKRGVYALYEDYDKLELSGKILSPSYVSLQFVLLKGGVIFQYSEEITCVGLLSRRFVIDSNSFTYRKIKDDIFYNDLGIIKENNYTIATTERALLDLMYLFGDYHFDNLMGVNWDMCFEILPIYDNKSLEKRVIKLHERVTKDA